MISKRKWLLIGFMSVLLITLVTIIVFAFGISSSMDLTKKTSKSLDNVALPQLNNAPSKNESEVILNTTAGQIKIKLFDKIAPLAVDNFLTHAKDGYYNGTTFHRIIKDFMIQGGDPKGNGSGGHSIWYNKNPRIDNGNGFKNEISSSLYNIRGGLSMANSGPDTNGSQFFINQNTDNQSKKLDTSHYPRKIIEQYKHGGNPSLDGDYTVFGQVIDGMTVVDKIASAEVKSEGEHSTPLHPIEINNITILKETK